MKRVTILKSVLLVAILLVVSLPLARAGSGFALARRLAEHRLPYHDRTYRPRPVAPCCSVTDAARSSGRLGTWLDGRS
jgi:hypothetical protein